MAAQGKREETLADQEKFVKLLDNLNAHKASLQRKVGVWGHLGGCQNTAAHSREFEPLPHQSSLPFASYVLPAAGRAAGRRGGAAA